MGQILPINNVFTRLIMRQQIIEILQNNLIEEQAILDIIVGEEKITCVLDISGFKANKEEADKISRSLKSQLSEKLKIAQINIIFTNNNFAPKKVETKIEQKTEPKAVNPTVKKEIPHANHNSVKGVKKIIAVASAKGGVGKSTLAVNLAAALNRVGHKVALVDADIYGPSIAHLMDLKTKPEIKGDLMIPLISNDIKCISIASLIDDNAAGVWRGPMITKILHQLIKGVEWNFDGKDVDVMIIDMPPGTGDVYLSLAEKFPLNGVVLVSTPQSLAVIDLVRSVDCFKKLNIPIIGLIQNMSYFLEGVEREPNFFEKIVNKKQENAPKKSYEKRYIFGKDGAKDLAKKYGINFLGEISINADVAKSSDDKEIFIKSHAKSDDAFAIGRIAEEIIDLVK